MRRMKEFVKFTCKLLKILKKISMSSEEVNFILPDFDCVLEKLGEGGYGIVCLVEHDGEIVARKVIDFGDTVSVESDGRRTIKRGLNSKAEVSELIEFTMDEIETLKKLKHENIIQLVDSYIDAENYRIYIYSKYCKNGDLRNRIYEKRKKNEDFSLSVYNFMNILYIGDN